MSPKGKQVPGAPVTSRDVARLAGVSQPTVSRALRGQHGVAEETLRRIQEAAAALGYVPSQLGRGLSTRSTRRVGIVAAELTNPFYPHIVEPLHSHFERAGFRSVLFTERENNPVEFADLVDGLLDGVVLTTTLLGSKLPEELDRRGLPFVFLNRRSEHGEGDAVVVDNVYGGSLVADLFVECGHRRIGAVLGPSDTSTGSEREKGFRDRLAHHGLELDPEITARGGFSFTAGVAGLRTLLSAAEPPTAVFCANDVIALGALDEATRLGIQIPQDISVVGFDDITLAAWNRFDLTTVHTDLFNLAAVAADLLLKRIAEPTRVHTQVVQRPQLMLRGSHAQLPAKARQRRPRASKKS
jgi:LacI family transcriptional regulator